MISHSYARRLTLMLSAVAVASLPVSAMARAPRNPALVQPIPPTPEPADPRTRIRGANAAARVEPERTSYFNAIQQYAYAEGALFQIYTSPGHVTNIMLQQGEELVGPGPVASGDTVRWIIGDTVSGSGLARRVHILIKPTRADISTNLVINTNRRTYHLELSATTSTYMAAVSWTYPQDALIALRSTEVEAERTAPVAAGIDFSTLNFDYRLAGDRPTWRPVRVFDDGRQVFVEFPPTVATGDMPPLFVIGADRSAELVNYRVQGRFMVVDRLFDMAELRLGSGRSARHVRILRESQRGGGRS
ncbi:P-type conjugative transfer protein TrbG (plasmid) [Blastomonas sp. RAC04]|uniref:P-type conjugative transfer protein TrbG n=1 Tax=Blastomonas sp. RAC04 TaxID=1842535 RepID=UPI00083D3DE9|nr:P-type conjugative transfer protein TrbG [Blastomonas sp. RAC04]AOF98752.1 P-type conjugative transfer protein TrbG [Blastomonas sp. RAC04]